MSDVLGVAALTGALLCFEVSGLRGIGEWRSRTEGSGYTPAAVKNRLPAGFCALLGI
jgi:hypothetical protein